MTDETFSYMDDLFDVEDGECSFGEADPIESFESHLHMVTRILGLTYAEAEIWIKNNPGATPTPIEFDNVPPPF